MIAPNLVIDSAHLQNQLEALAAYSDTPSPAITRILFTPMELKARQYIRDLMTQAGLQIHEDAMGNIFGRWHGTEAELPAVSTGSHIDAIPLSGRFDGTVGVLGAIEAIRALKQAGFQPKRSIEVIMFTAEEPTRFGIGCIGSRAMSGALSPQVLEDLQDKDGLTFGAVRQSAGYTTPLESIELKSGYYHAFVELHIEQGPRLEASGIPIGIVTAIAAPATLRIIIEGEGGHAGTVLMPTRKDALTASAELILAVEKIARESTSPDAVATVGLVNVYPGAVNSIPNRVVLEVDIRDIDIDSHNEMIKAVQQTLQNICQKRDVSGTLTILNQDAPCYAGQEVVSTLVTLSQSLGLPHQQMVSRAYHDTLFMAQICPVSMIFVPSQGGYSHRPEEYTSIEDITQGVTLLAHALADLAMT
ncbi:MAG: Zn-dependent hydrolase [Chloroflexi bacterium AL-W]|nr:Zn-dependent hydrolase [Chloroflexi bacterium AL-W]